ncbi:DNA-binding transcriptional regulator, LysR family [Phyllobacterium sp. CL33Tsu]|uniref:LysR family transcriptional regulator n=1 Tax=Phyllobacterium sp. CL33Tsu TaxID=1798191 RepID=UPI0008E22150|nr:LysR family transcriptional regulator [Phyllobacterium sp. CL33Tsu]SFI56631.1 DNA-binding transcriptional regulator, LysR family [Phyllobacterium sp. CL33Tsu]
MDRLSSMNAFVRAVDLGSFAAAADSLGLSAPMVGKHIQFLEHRLGARLLNRTTRRQSLTDFGKDYYERCRIILAETEAADALAEDQRSEPRGKLRVTMPTHFGRHCVLPVLLDLVRTYPALELDLSFGDRLVDLAEDGYDLAIRTGNVDNRAGVIARRIARQPMVVCAAPGYLERNGHPETVDDLGRHQAVIYRRSGPIPLWRFPQHDEPVITMAPNSRVRLDDLEAVVDATVAAMGISWLPFWLVRDRLADGSLVRLLPDQENFLYDCHALWLQNPLLSLKVRVAVDALAAGLPRLMI